MNVAESGDLGGNFSEYRGIHLESTAALQRDEFEGLQLNSSQPIIVTNVDESGAAGEDTKADYMPKVEEIAEFNLD